MPDIINIDDFTTGTIGGTGVYDVLMTGVKAHLREEFDAGRIRATDYSNAYVQLMSVVLAESGQFVISKAKLAAEIKLLEAQARNTDADTSIKEYQLENILPTDWENLKKTGLGIDAQTDLTVKQGLDVIAGTMIKEYQLLNMLPVELENLTKTGLGITAQTDNVNQNTENLLSQKTLAEEKHLLEMQAIEVQIGKTTADTVLVTKQCLLTEAQAITQSAYSTQINAQSRQIDYITTFQIPSQIAATEAQTELTIAQESQITQQTLNTVAERSRIDAQTSEIIANTALRDIEKDIQIFNRDFKLPKELILMEKEVLIKESQVALANKELLVKQAQVDVALKDIQLKQNQIDLGIKELAIKTAQLAIAEKELLLKNEQLAVAKYELLHKLPADVALVVSQAELYAQKVVTELAQVDATPIGDGSVIGVNNHLIEEQAKTFLRQGQQTAAKLLIDTWNTRHIADPNGNYADETNNLGDATISKAVKALLNGIDINAV